MKKLNICGNVVTEEDIKRVKSPVLRQALKVRFAVENGKVEEEISGCLCVPIAPGSNHPNYKAYRVRRK